MGMGWYQSLVAGVIGVHDSRHKMALAGGMVDLQKGEK